MTRKKYLVFAMLAISLAVLVSVAALLAIDIFYHHKLQASGGIANRPASVVMSETMARRALGKFAVSRSATDASEMVRNQAEVEQGRLVASIATVQYLAWAIPAIGFLGTVRGLAGSMTLKRWAKSSKACPAGDATTVSPSLPIAPPTRKPTCRPTTPRSWPAS